MFPQTEKLIREQMKHGLCQLDKKHHALFKRMYAHKNMEISVYTIVDQMATKNLEWALSQIKRTLDNKKKMTKKTSYAIWT